MRKLVATEYLSLDGVFEEPGHWSFPYFSDDAGRFKYEELLAADALLLGRLTYEGFAAAWPTMEGTGEFGERMNGMAKYVVSSTLRDPAWTNSQVIAGDVVAEVTALKDGSGMDILLAGSGQLFRHLMGANLIDEYRFMVHPVVLGGGKKLFADAAERRPLQLAGTQALTSGIVVLTYRPAP